MNTLVRQDPWSLVSRSSATASWSPAVDVHEYADRFEFYVDLPGVDPSQVELTLERGVLTLSGERSTTSLKNKDEEPQLQRTERGLGHFYRRFVLPQSVDHDKVSATGKDGVLTVTVPKQAKAMPRRIQIAA